MDKVTVFTVTFYAPGSFVAETWSREVAGPEPEAVEWPENAYAFRMSMREDVLDGPQRYKGPSHDLGPMYYHPDSKVETAEQVQANPKATRTLLDNMRCNGWHALIWTRWGNWPQPFDADQMAVLPRRG